MPRRKWLWHWCGHPGEPGPWQTQCQNRLGEACCEGQDLFQLDRHRLEFSGDRLLSKCKLSWINQTSVYFWCVFIQWEKRQKISWFGNSKFSFCFSNTFFVILPQWLLKKKLLKLILLATKVWRFELARINNIDVIADKKQIAGSFVQVQHFQWRNENNDMLPTRHSVEIAEIYPHLIFFFFAKSTYALQNYM